jgi:serine palmitoyltransferase
MDSSSNYTSTSSIMNASDISEHVITLVNAASEQFHKIPGSAIFLRYVQSSYQNDPVRSAVELFLVLFAIRYLLAPTYSTKAGYVKLSEEVRYSSGMAVLEGVRRA